MAFIRVTTPVGDLPTAELALAGLLRQDKLLALQEGCAGLPGARREGAERAPQSLVALPEAVRPVGHLGGLLGCERLGLEVGRELALGLTLVPASDGLGTLLAARTVETAKQDGLGGVAPPTNAKNKSNGNLRELAQGS